MLRVVCLVFNPFGENTYIVFEQDSRQAFIIDPGCSTPQEESQLAMEVARLRLTPVAVVNTHCHLDHVLGNAFATQHWKVPLWCHKDDLFLLEGLPQQAMIWGVRTTPSPRPARYLEDGDIIQLGGSALQVIHSPGHSPGHIVLFALRERFLICGDVLFAGSIGRTDLPGGNYTRLMQSIERLLELGDDVRIYPGHGPETTLGTERHTNPFVVEWLAGKRP